MTKSKTTTVKMHLSGKARHNSNRKFPNHNGKEHRHGRSTFPNQKPQKRLTNEAAIKRMISQLQATDTSNNKVDQVAHVLLIVATVLLGIYLFGRVALWLKS